MNSTVCAQSQQQPPEPLRAATVMIIVGRDKSGEALVCRLDALRRDAQNAKLNLVSEIKLQAEYGHKAGGKNDKVETWFCPFNFNYVGTDTLERCTRLRMRTREYGENCCLSSVNAF